MQFPSFVLEYIVIKFTNCFFGGKLETIEAACKLPMKVVGVTVEDLHPFVLGYSRVRNGIQKHPIENVNERIIM
jgi:hypothetical protein